MSIPTRPRKICFHLCFIPTCTAVNSPNMDLAVSKKYVNLAASQSSAYRMKSATIASGTFYHPCGIPMIPFLVHCTSLVASTAVSKSLKIRQRRKEWMESQLQWDLMLAHSFGFVSHTHHTRFTHNPSLGLCTASVHHTVYKACIKKLPSLQSVCVEQ